MSAMIVYRPSSVHRKQSGLSGALGGTAEPHLLHFHRQLIGSHLDLLCVELCAQLDLVGAVAWPPEVVPKQPSEREEQSSATAGCDAWHYAVRCATVGRSTPGRTQPRPLRRRGVALRAGTGTECAPLGRTGAACEQPHQTQEHRSSRSHPRPRARCTRSGTSCSCRRVNPAQALAG